MITNILLTCLIIMLTQLALHWFPWELVIGRRLPRLAAYTLGVLAIMIPLTGLFFYEYMVLIALWSAVISAGSAVFAGYGIDYLARRVRLSHELQEVLDAKGRSTEGN